VTNRPDVIILMTDEERAIPPYESPEVLAWRERTLHGRKWFDEHGVSFTRHYTGSLACAPSRPTIFTGHYPANSTQACPGGSYPGAKSALAVRLSPAALACRLGFVGFCHLLQHAVVDDVDP
jgi:arylsulfatase A-like enzyme